MSGHLFISYSHDDLADVQKLVGILGTYNISLWWDKAIQPGREFTPQIQKAIKTCGAALLLLSSTFLKSEYIWTNEVPALMNADIPMLPLVWKGLPYDNSGPLEYDNWVVGLPNGVDQKSKFLCQLLELSWPRGPEEGAFPREEDGSIEGKEVIRTLVPAVRSTLRSAKSNEWFRKHFVKSDDGLFPDAFWIEGAARVDGIVEPTLDGASFGFRPAVAWTGRNVDLPGGMVRTTVSPEGDLLVLEAPDQQDGASTVTLRSLAYETGTFEFELPSGTGPVLACWNSVGGDWAHLVCADGAEWAFGYHSGSCICLGKVRNLDDVIDSGTHRLARIAFDGVASTAWIRSNGELVGDGPANIAASFVAATADARWIDLDATVWKEETRGGFSQRVAVAALTEDGALHAVRGVAIGEGSVHWEAPVNGEVLSGEGIASLRLGRVHSGGGPQHLALGGEENGLKKCWFSHTVFGEE